MTEFWSSPVPFAGVLLGAVSVSAMIFCVLLWQQRALFIFYSAASRPAVIVRGAFEVFPELLLALGARVSISTTAFGGKAMKLFFCRRGVMPARQTFAGVAGVLRAARELLNISQK